MDIKALGDQIVSTVKEFVSRRLEDVTKRLDDLAKRIDEFPVPKDGKDGDSADMNALFVHIEEEVGKRFSPALEAVEARIAEKEADVSVALSAIKEIKPPVFDPPKDGKDADMERVAEIIRQAVDEAREEIRASLQSEFAVKSKALDEALAAAARAVPVFDPPKDGEPGRDALDLDVMLSIDEERRYRRGSYATHKGGLWKTIRTSEGMDGWECIVDGLDAVEIEMTGDREITVKTRLSSGREVAKSFAVPVVLDRGVFKDGTAYKTGDGVTWAGSFWIAQRDTSEKPDASNSGFRLAVKRGRDGKESMPLQHKTAPLRIDGSKGVA